MPNVPDWFWQGLAVWLSAKGIEWVWNHRQEVAAKLERTSEDIVINLQPLTLRAEAQPAHVSVVTKRQFSYAVRVAEESRRGSSYRVEALKPTLARRLEDLALWYLRASKKKRKRARG